MHIKGWNRRDKFTYRSGWDNYYESNSELILACLIAPIVSYLEKVKPVKIQQRAKLNSSHAPFDIWNNSFDSLVSGIINVSSFLSWSLKTASCSLLLHFFNCYSLNLVLLLFDDDMPVSCQVLYATISCLVLERCKLEVSTRKIAF